MLTGEDIICISSIDWDFIWQQHQEIMTAFAKNGNRVLFIENTGVRSPRFSDTSRIWKRIVNWHKSTKGFRQEMPNLYVYSPLILPFPYSRLARIINRFLILRSLQRWGKVMQFQNPIIWTFIPTPIALDIQENIPHKAFIYYCTDNFAATSRSAKKIIAYEKQVLQKADAVFVMARNLVEYCKAYNSRTTCIPMGVNPAIFEKAAEVTVMPKEIAGIASPIIGFIGGVRQSIDQELVVYLAHEFPKYSFVFVGPVQTDIVILKQCSNIIFTGRKHHQELGAYLKYFDVCIIPYIKDAYTDNISAAKLNEYLVLGKPVVSTNLHETELFNKENGDILYIAKNREEFKTLISRALIEDCETLKKRRIHAAYNNSWAEKIEQMSLITQDIIVHRDNIHANWQKILTDIYRNVHRKAFRIIVSLAFAWGLLFYTPFVWICAKPLMISQPPVHADAIVVFAGGVGESGTAGQGYEERVQQAVELYNKGYADQLIFSSGYTYAFKEPLVMKALAISLGVPVRSITLEEKAKNTFENVKFTKEILARNGWGKILLISAPYHMRRASLVFHKVANDIKVTYVPITNGRFYMHKVKGIFTRKISLSQINGIAHEYFGILYYWWKGWI